MDNTLKIEIPENFKEKMDFAKTYGLSILESCSDSDIKNAARLSEISEDYDISILGNQEEKMISFRYRPRKKERVSFADALRGAKKAINNRDYEQSLIEFRKVLESPSPRLFVFVDMARSYQALHNYEAALPFFIYATEMSKMGFGHYNYSKIIANLKGRLTGEPWNNKATVHMTEEDFSNSLDNFYGIEYIDKIIELVLYGVKLEDICKEFELSDEQKVLIMLIIAREYYAIERYNMGDIYLKNAERSKNKTPLIKSELEKVRKNKKFYKNRVDDKRVSLVDREIKR